MNVILCYDYNKDSARSQKVASLLKSKGNNITLAVNDSNPKWEEEMDRQLKKIDIAIVLISKNTLDKYFIKYEICNMANKGIPILGLKVDKMVDENGNLDDEGNEFTIIGNINGEPLTFNSVVADIYDYVNDDAENNIQEWIEEIL